MIIDQKIDKAIEVRDRYREAKRASDTLNEEYKALEEEIINELKELGSRGFRATLGTATPGEQQIAVVDDWDELWQWIFDQRANYLLQRRLANAAITEYHTTTGELPPGVRLITKDTLSLRKR